MQNDDDQLLGQLSESQIGQIAKMIGADDETTRNAIAAAIPTLLGGMGRAVESDAGAQKLTSQMQGIQGNLDDLFGNLPRAKPSSLDGPLGPGNEVAPPKIPGFGSSRAPAEAPSGGGLLEDIFGSKKKRVEDSIGKSSGLDLSKIGPLLAILAPIVLGALKSRVASASTRSSGGQLDTNDVRDILRGERRRIESRPGGGMIGSLLDQDGDGDFDFSDIIKIGMRFLTGSRR